MLVRRELWRGIPVDAHPCLQVQGEFPAPGGGIGSMSGEFRLRRLERTVHGIRAVGTVGGSLRDGAGRPIGQASRRIVLPLSSGTTASLREALDRVEVDLLGLRVSVRVCGTKASECGLP